MAYRAQIHAPALLLCSARSSCCGKCWRWIPNLRAHSLSTRASLKRTQYARCFGPARGDWLEAEDAFQATVTLDALEPFTTQPMRSVLRQSAGLLRRALDEARRAYQLAPADPTFSTSLALNFCIIGDDVEALRYAEQAADLGFPRTAAPLTQIRWHAAHRAGLDSEACALLLETLAFGCAEPGRVGARRRVISSRGGPDKARCHARGPRTGGGCHSRDGVQPDFPQDADVVVRDARRARPGVVSRLPCSIRNDRPLLGIAMDAGDAALQADARFQAFVNRLGLPEHWRRFGPPDGFELRDGALFCVE